MGSVPGRVLMVAAPPSRRGLHEAGQLTSLVLCGSQSAFPLHPRIHDLNSRSEDQSSERLSDLSKTHTGW